jgi:hypothetical protein
LRAPLRPAVNRESTAKKRAEVRLNAPKLIATFDPSLLITALTAGKSRREYSNEDSVFSQGDAANAVFYIERG